MDIDWRGHWAGRARYVVLMTHDDGALTGEWLQRWRDDPTRPARLHLIAVRGGGPLPGFQRQLQEDSAVTVDVLHAPLGIALARLQARLDMVCIDAAFDPACARPLARLLARDARMQLTEASAQASAQAGGQASAQAVAQASAQSGAQAWEALRASGWERTETSADTPHIVARFASRKPIAPEPPPPQRQAIVIGAGLAGAAACERLCARGWQVTLIEQHAQAAMEASGNRAGITLPMLSKDDNRASRLSRAAYLFASDYWQRLGGVGDTASGAAIEGARCGVLLAARDAAHAALQRAIASAHAWPAGYASWMEGGSGSGTATAIAALKTVAFDQVAPHGAWLFPGGGWLRPASAVAAMLGACGTMLSAHFGAGPVMLHRQDGLWIARDAAGAAIASAPVVVVASGGGQLAQTAALPIVRIRGQVTHLMADGAAARIPELGLVLCREAYLTPAAGGIRSIGATYDDDLDPTLRQSSQDENLAHLRGMLADPAAVADVPLAGRVGFRAVATDRLPIVGAVPEPAFALGAERLRDVPRQTGLYALLGYASRGLTWAPLAAEVLAATLEGEPLPLETDLMEALDPGRFLLRARRKKTAGLRESAK